MIIFAGLAVSALWSTPPSAAPDARYAMRAWYAQNDTCRGSEGDTSELACSDRDVSERRLRRLGWCWTSGGRAEVYANWRRCRASSNPGWGR